ncbi:MAG TPA: 30S ribosomal protein S16 [Flavobacteriales bacterium]|jgi:small subunit ribosomal protein S16|nr:30S ribosomal protein S16 [Flavobacteriales bacterium]
MPVKLRLQRHGKKGKPYYHIVVADARSKRDGRYIEKLGFYNPNTNPASLEIDFDRALYWLQSGAQPTDTCRAILSYKGVLLKNHLDRGVKKGALTEEQANARFEKWMEEKAGKIDAKSNSIAKDAEALRKELLKAEAAVKEKKAAEYAAKNAELAAEVEAEAAEAEDTPVAEEAPAAEPPAEEGK